MPTRRVYIERILRNIYGGQPSDDSSITVNLVNSYLNTGVALAAKQSYADSIKTDGVEYVNNSFYTTYKDLSIIADDSDNQCFSITLPHVPVGIGEDSGISSLKFKTPSGLMSVDTIPVSVKQVTYIDRLRPIPNKILRWYEGDKIKFKTAIPMIGYKGIVRMVSGGDPNNLNGNFIVPEDYYPIIEAYVKSQLKEERAIKKDAANDGVDIP